MPREFRPITSDNASGGTTFAKDVTNIDVNQNVEAKNMTYTPKGEAITDGGFADPGIDWGEDNEGIDGLGKLQDYPDLIWAAVNGKVKYYDTSTEPESSATAYEADTALSLTKDNRVGFIGYRGNLYVFNGTDNMVRIAVGKLDTAITTGSTTIELEDANGLRFTNGTDKIYIEGDEIDYTAVSTDDLTTVTNISVSHAKGTFVTQMNTLTAPASGSLKTRTVGIFRDTMFTAPTDEPNVLRYGKTVSSVSTIADIHDFSDGNNYLIGEGAEINALHGTRDRLYVFTRDKTFYIGIEINSSALESFSPDRLFTPNYGCPNHFCVAEMEDVVIFYSGERLIRIGFEPEINQLLPDETFDEEIFDIINPASGNDHASSSLVYNPTSKKMLLTFNSGGGTLRTLIFDNRLKNYAYPMTHDPSSYIVIGGKLYFGDPTNDVTFKFGEDVDADGAIIEHAYTTGRYGQNRVPLFFRRGYIEGLIAKGTTIKFVIKINGDRVGKIRDITDARISGPKVSAGEATGEDTVGMTTVGGGGGTVALFPFRFPFTVGQRGRDLQLELSSLSEGAVWGFKKWGINGVSFERLPDEHF